MIRWFGSDRWTPRACVQDKTGSPTHFDETHPRPLEDIQHCVSHTGLGSPDISLKGCKRMAPDPGALGKFRLVPSEESPSGGDQLPVNHISR